MYFVKLIAHAIKKSATRCLLPCTAMAFLTKPGALLSSPFAEHATLFGNAARAWASKIIARICTVRFVRDLFRSATGHRAFESRACYGVDDFLSAEFHCSGVEQRPKRFLSDSYAAGARRKYYRHYESPKRGDVDPLSMRDDVHRLRLSYWRTDITFCAMNSFDVDVKYCRRSGLHW